MQALTLYILIVLIDTNALFLAATSPMTVRSLSLMRSPTPEQRKTPKPPKDAR